MQIECPNCATAYEVPDAVFGGRARRMRCEQCGFQWRAGPPGVVVEEAAQPPVQAPRIPVWPENIAPADEPPARVFGKPTDASAHAEVSQALSQEAQNSPPPATPAEPNEVEGAPLSEPKQPQHYYVLAADPNADNDDPFINLVLAARSRAIELEPEPPPVPPVSISSPAFFGALVVLVVLAIAGLFFKNM